MQINLVMKLRTVNKKDLIKRSFLYINGAANWNMLQPIALFIAEKIKHIHRRNTLLCVIIKLSTLNTGFANVVLL